MYVYKLMSLTLGVFIVLAAGLEGVAHSDWAHQTFWTPSYTPDYPEFDIKIDLLDAYVAEHGGVDCIVLGSSLVAYGIQIDQLTAAYTTQSGDTLRCFNFGMPTMTASGLGVVSEFLVERYAPRLLILELAPRSFFVRNPRSLIYLEGSAWFRARDGAWNWRGELVQHSRAFRYLQRYQNWANPPLLNEQRTRYLDTASYIVADGSHLRQHFNYPVTIPPASRVVGQDAGLYDLHRALTHIEDKHRDGLARAFALHGDTTQILVLEMPHHTSYDAFFAASDYAYAALMADVQSLADEYGVAMWSTRQLAATIPDEFWRDRIHLNYNGGVVFSAWLGQQLALGAPHGLGDELPRDLPNPTLALPAIDDFGITLAPAYAGQYTADVGALYLNLGEDVVILNPNPMPENYHYQALNIVQYLNIGRFNQPDDVPMGLTLITLFENSRTVADFPPDTFAPWYNTWSAADLQAAGVDYLLLSEVWLGSLPAEARAQFDDPTQYRYIRLWHYGGLPTGYILYEVVAP